MAGIGFNLKKILEGDTLFSSFKAYFYSTWITSGPWILSILTLFCLSFFVPATMTDFELIYFKSLIIYIFAFSLIVISLIQFPLTRYLADKLYLEEREALIPVLHASALVVLVVQSLIGGVYLAWIGMHGMTELLVLAVYLVISLVWLMMLFLTALKEYRVIVGAYAAGAITAVLVSLWLGEHYGMAGYLTGYLTGHLLIVVIWAARIYTEFSSRDLFDFRFLKFLSHNRSLVFAGFFYTLAIWVDKMVFWVSSLATPVAKGIRIFPPYDFTSFLAYLTILPSLAYFLVQMETDFYRHYRRFYLSILNRVAYSMLEKRRQKIANSLKNNLITVIVYQGIISAGCILFAPQIVEGLNLPDLQVLLFRILVLGAFLHGLLLIMLLVILYFDLRRVAVWVGAVFLGCNALFTAVTIPLGQPYFGYGYLFSALAALMTGYYLLDFNLKRLEFLTFASQPIGVHREEEVM